MAALRENQIHQLFKPTLLLFQIFGFMPLRGIRQPLSSSLNFSWYDFRIIYSLITLFGFLFISIFQIIRLCILSFTMIDVQRFWLGFCSAVTSILFINLAKKWAGIVRKWQAVEQEMIHYGDLMKLQRKIRIICCCFLTIAILDGIIIKIHRIEADLVEGNVQLNLETWNHLQKNRYFFYIYDFLPYDIFSGILLTILHIQNYFSITLVDFFIVVISLVLSTSQQEITAKIQRMAEAGVFSELKWKEIREDYNRLETLCRFINSHIGSFIVLSYIRNLGSVLILLFYSFILRENFSGKLYLYCSCFFVLCRCMAVCLFGSMINEESRKPLKYLFSVPQAPFNVEIDRLIRQIKGDTMALTGLGVFSVKRDIILNIAGSIVTYELVLIQFAGDVIKETPNGNNTRLVF